MTVPFTISGDGITAGDYTLAGAVGTAVTLPAASADTSIGPGTVPVLTLTLTATDDADTSEELLAFTLSSGDGYTVSATAGSALVAIKPAGTPTLEFTTDAVSVTERPGGRTATMEMRLSGSPANDLVVPVSTTDETALAGTDYTALSTDIMFAAGATGAALTQTVQVEITDDRVDEPLEDFTIAFSPLFAGSSGVYSVTVTIVDDDIPELSVLISRDSINEGEETTIQIISDIVIGNILFATRILRYGIRGDGITSSDYTLTSDFTRRQTDQGYYLVHSVTLRALPDGDDLERLIVHVIPAELYLYTVNPSNGSATLTINPAGTPPLPQVEFGTSYFLAPESAGTARLSVQMNISPVDNVMIPITMTDGTATAGEDYTALPAAVTFPAGATGDDLIQTISIPLLDDRLDEHEETFTVTFGTLPAAVYAGARDTVSMMLAR